jgi:hypothetical protein
VPADEAARICERRERTGWSPRRLADEPDIARPHSTIHQVLRRGECSRRPRPARPAIVRYEWPCPGQLLHMDVKKLGCFEAPGHAVRCLVAAQGKIERPAQDKVKTDRRHAERLVRPADGRRAVPATRRLIEMVAAWVGQIWDGVLIGLRARVRATHSRTS